MEHILLIMLVMISILLCADAFRFQKAVIKRTRCLSSHSEGNFLTRIQDAITLKSQIARNISIDIHILMIILYVLGKVIYQWHKTIDKLVVSFSIISLLVVTLIPKPKDCFSLNAIKKSLKKHMYKIRSNPMVEDRYIKMLF